MGRLTVRLPSTLHHQLTMTASHEGVSLNQYIVYALTRQNSLAYTTRKMPQADTAQERASFEQLLENLSAASEEEMKRVLAEREVIKPTSGVEREAIAQLQSQMKGTPLVV